MEMYYESRQELPVVDQADVVVCGGGPAGVAAAVAAARTGASTRLLEVHGCLGGIWTSGLLVWLLDVANQPGIMTEITGELQRRGVRATRGGTDYAYDVEVMKLLLEEMCGAAGVRLQLHTRAVAAGRDPATGISHAVTESKSGRQAWRAKVFVDATGDGDLAALAGCGFDLGREGTRECQPMSLECLIMGVKADDIATFIGGGASEPKKRLLAEMKRAGVDPSYAAPTIFRIRDDLFCLAANHEYGASAIDAAQITQATIRARAELHRIVDALRALGGPWANVRIAATGEQIGVREGRRIHGLYRVTVDDLLAGARHEDAVCRVTFPIDVHSTDPSKGKAYGGENRRTKPYDIPLRALVSRDVENLLVAGRCISGDFLAHSSYRVSGPVVSMGQAAGVTAAIAAKTGRRPKDVPWAEVGPGIERLCKR